MQSLILAAILIVAASMLWLALETRRLRTAGDEALRAAREAGELHAQSTREALEIAAWHATTAAAAVEAARQSATATRLLAETSQRAWLAVDGIHIMTRNGRNFPVSISTVIRNGGRTPAMDVETAQFHVIESAPAESHRQEPAEMTPEGNLGPGSAAKVASTLEYPPGSETAGRIREGELLVLVYGTARYKDILGNSRETSWAYRYEVDLCQFRPCTLNNEIK
ncbi:MAG: hypothetical protein ABSG79_03015 [Bryobacteraceae bacterium]|jgi:hypothetical protein